MDTEVRRTMEIVNKLGLHARAAAKLIELASGFGSRIRIRRDGREADAKSIMKLMMLAAPKGTSIEVMARGDDAAEGGGSHRAARRRAVRRSGVGGGGRRDR